MAVLSLYDFAKDAIPALKLQEGILAVLASALVVHLVYNRYEVHPADFIPTFFLLVATPGLSSVTLLPHFSSPVLAYLVGFATFYAGLLTSIAVYRLSPWHPLARYPGPILAKLSKLWTAYNVATGNQHRVVAELHRKYGDFVRTGPNELSINNADLVPALLAPDMPKGPVWDGRGDPTAPPLLAAVRSSKYHAEKRVFWNHAFSSTAVNEYMPIIINRALQLVEELDKLVDSGEVNIVHWMTAFSFDLMGDMVFGGGFELMREGDKDGILSLMQKSLYIQACTSHCPWTNRLLMKLPSARAEVLKFRAFTTDCVMRRQRQGSHMKDLFYHLVNEDLKSTNKAPLTVDEVAANGELAIIGGSDTTAVSLSAVFFYITLHPECYARLRVEVDENFSHDPYEDPFDRKRLADMKYLNAVINEAMRLIPAAMTLLHRAPEKGTGGKNVGGHFLSEGTAVNVPPYVLHRDTRNFSPRPNDFWPDRWLGLENTSEVEGESGSEPIITNTTAYLPFSAGNANCVGKGLALADMRSVVAILVQRFNMRFADGYDPRKFEAELRDQIVVKLGEVPILLSRRL